MKSKHSLALTLGLAFLFSACDAPTKNVNSCGDGFLDPGEACDQAALAGQTCLSLGYYRNEGVLACGADCTFDVSDCGAARCGDGLIQSAYEEECEGSDLDTQSCQC